MKCQPLVSVVVTCYNYGKYLKNCLESVLNQTYKNIEILIVDDGSTDNTAELMKNFIGTANIKYIYQNNAGQSRAKNVGIKNANGDFIAFLDADDLWCAEKIKKQISFFGKNEVGVVYCKAKYFDEDDDEVIFELTSPYIQPKRGKVTEALLLDNFVPFSSSMVRKECFEKFGVFDETLKMGIDWDLWLRISTAYEFDFVDEQLFYYRIGHNGQMSKNVEVRQQCSDRIMERFLAHYPETVGVKTIEKATYYTYCNRGEYYRFIDKRKSTNLFLKAIRTLPFKKDAYKGLVKNLINYNSGSSTHFY